MRIPIFIFILTTIAGCGSNGHLVAPRKSLDFVHADSGRVIVTDASRSRYEITDLRGDVLRSLSSSRSWLADVDANANRALFGTGGGFIAADDAQGDRYFEADVENNAGALSASGRFIATTDPATKSIRIWSFETLGLLRTVPCPEALCSLVAWDPADEDVIWTLGVANAGWNRIELATGKVELFAAKDRNGPVKVPAAKSLFFGGRCPETGATLALNNDGVFIDEPGKARRRLVELRGYWPSLLGENWPLLDNGVFVAHCRYVYFKGYGRQWLADAQTGEFGAFPREVVHFLP